MKFLRCTEGYNKIRNKKNGNFKCGTTGSQITKIHNILSFISNQYWRGARINYCLNLEVRGIIYLC